MLTYIVPLEVHGHLFYRMLYITSPAGLLHPTLVWRFQEATNIPMQGGTWPVCPLMPWHYWYSFTPEWGEALSILSKGVLNPSYLSFDSGQSQTHNLSHMSQELYHCTTPDPSRHHRWGRETSGSTTIDCHSVTLIHNPCNVQWRGPMLSVPRIRTHCMSFPKYKMFWMWWVWSYSSRLPRQDTTIRHTCTS